MIGYESVFAVLHCRWCDCVCEVSCWHVRLRDRAVVVVVLWTVCRGSVLAGWLVCMHGVPAWTLRHDIRCDDGDVLWSMSSEHVRRCNGIDDDSVQWRLHARSWHVLSRWRDVVVAVAVSSRYFKFCQISHTHHPDAPTHSSAHARTPVFFVAAPHQCIDAYIAGVQVDTAWQEHRRRAIHVPLV